MTMQISFSKYEQALRGDYRKKINSAESTEDVKKFFVRTVIELFEKALDRKVVVDYDDVHLDPKRKDGFVISERLRTVPGFVSAWSGSDLPDIVRRMAESAIKRHKRLEAHRNKTEAKMYPTPGSR